MSYEVDYKERKPIPGEKVIVDFDESEDLWLIVGEKSDFAYGSWCSKSEAEDYYKKYFMKDN